MMQQVILFSNSLVDASLATIADRRMKILDSFSDPAALLRSSRVPGGDAAMPLAGGGSYRFVLPLTTAGQRTPRCCWLSVVGARRNKLCGKPPKYAPPMQVDL